jgi:CubicO group peptidase (beta-lactamase class C family)
MRSGLDNADGFGESADPTMLFVSRLLFGEGSRGPAEYATNVALVHPIGERWAYSTGTSIMIARLCGERVGKGREDTVGFLRRELFDPIGMRSAQPEFAASGEFMGGAFVHATARDWARFGYLYLRDGEWAGRRILPEGWVDFSRSPSPAENNVAYGAHFWINQVATDVAGQWTPLPGGPGSAFMAEGASFQMVVVVPEKDLVAVRLGIDQGTPFPEIKEPFGPLISAFPDRR